MLARGRCKSFFPLQGRVKKRASVSPLVHFTIGNDTFLDESTVTSFLFQFGCLLKSVSYYRSGESRPCLLFIPSYFYRISRDHFNVVTTKTVRRYEIFFEHRNAYLLVFAEARFGNVCFTRTSRGAFINGTFFHRLVYFREHTFVVWCFLRRNTYGNL